jgi:Uma2 family endonuclease
MGERLLTQERGEAPVKHRLSVTDFVRMAEAGIFHEDDRIELIEGELIDMAPIGSKHYGIVNRLGELLTITVHGKATIGIQGPILLDDNSQPQPDLVLLKKRDDDYLASLPRPADVSLLIEVADTTLDYDRNTKIPLYARAGIPEVWLVNLKDNSIEVYREPSVAGYKLTIRPAAEDSISPTQFPEFSLKPEDLFR